METIFHDLMQAIIDLDESKSKELAKKVVYENMDFIKATEWCGKGLAGIGKTFQQGNIFLPELMKAAKIMEEIMKIIEPETKKKVNSRDVLGRVVIGTIQNDSHDIGKNIVATLLSVEGFEVLDIGKDVPILKFIEEAKQFNADIVAVSALLSSTMVLQKDLVDSFNEKDMRKQIKIMVGGAPVTPEWAESIGADGYGENAVMAVKVARKLLGRDE